VRFYQTPEPDSKKLVKGWWKRLSSTDSFKTGLFMHNEPMNTAADLAQKDVVPITDEVRNAYQAVLFESHYLVTRKPLQVKNPPYEVLAVAEEHVGEAPYGEEQVGAKKDSGKKKVPQKQLVGGA
jgi:hypothetical protein